MQQSHPPFATGQQVTVRDDSWVVLKAEAFTDAHLLHLRGIGSTNLGQLQSLLSPFDHFATLACSTRLLSVSRRHTLAAAALHVADADPWDHCWTAATADIELRSWQLEPALAAVRGATRILLADRVGLGKTIQAALVLSELLARGLAERVLVLTPAPLRQQWADELRTRFRLTPAVFDHASLTAAVAALPAGVNPWQTAPLIVSSIDLVKRPEVRSAIDAVAFDALVVDEAHHATRGTDRGAVVADLAARTPWIVLATATPHSGDNDAFEFLQQIGSTRGAPLLMFRRTSEISPRFARRSHLLAVVPTLAERALLDETSRYVRAIGRSAARAAGARLVASVIARRAASSAKALCGTLARRIALLSREAVPEIQPHLPWEDADADDGDTPDALLATPALANLEQEIGWLRRLLELAGQASARSSKVAVIRRLLRRTSESAVVFSEYRDVAMGVAAAIEDLAAVAVLHGGLSPRQRQDVVNAFNGGALRAVIATDAAGEGLNLHHRCRLVVNIELPWMPRRLEQRIGRVDRIGQQRRVHALHLVHRGSFEGTVVTRLERRRAQAGARTRDTRALDHDTPATESRRLRQVARGRRLTDRGAVFTSRGPRGPAPRRVVLLYGATLIDQGGRFVQRVALPIAVSVDPHSTSHRRLTRRLLRWIAADSTLQDVLSHEAASQCARGEVVLQQVAAALTGRLDECLATLDQRARERSQWQGSLFDSSSDALFERERSALRSVREHFERRRDEARALSTLRATAPRLLAAWLAD
jgi:superfamily II DNA or RNA helicase